MARRILVIGRETLLAGHLRRWDYDVVSTDSVTATLDAILAGARPCIVLVDLGIPGVDDVDLMRLLRSHLGALPVVAMAERHVPFGDLERLVDAVLIKPVGHTDLRRLLDGLCLFAEVRTHHRAARRDQS